MARKILIDMIKLRDAMIEDSSRVLPEAIFYQSNNINGLKTVRELAAFRYSCRRCEDAPCIRVCPSDALEKDNEGIVERHTNLCISCKSCVTICPFGTLMTDFFAHHRNREMLYDLKNEYELQEFVRAFPEGTITFTDEDETPDKNIYKLNEKVLIKDFLYSTEKL